MNTTLYSLKVSCFDTREEMGRAAAEAVAETLAELTRQKDRVRVVFAAAPSQNEFLRALWQDTRVDFSRIEAFHMDEYVGLREDAPQGFGNFLKERIFDRAPFGPVHYLCGQAEDPASECARYTALLREAPIDVVCLGIGENGHIAFNDPAVADFEDKAWVKRVALDEVCRMQQVHDGCFDNLAQVPTHALTLTLPALLSAKHHFCIVPALTKAEAVRRALIGPVGAQCPASGLRLCPDAHLFLDAQSASLLPGRVRR